MTPTRPTAPLRSLSLACAALASLLTLSACANLKPDPLKAEDVVSSAKTVQRQQAAQVEPLAGPMTLEEAIARALRHNAERRVRVMEEAIALGVMDLSIADTWPKVMASAGYRSRDTDLLTNMRNVDDPGNLIQGRTISSERNAGTADLGLTWSLLDFGQSYYSAKQSANRVLIAGERRRKAMHNLVQDVRTAYWRVVAADKLGASVTRTIAEAEQALQASESAEVAGLRSPNEPLRFQRQLLESLRVLETVQQELSTARVELATLVGLPPQTRFEIVEPGAKVDTAWLGVDPALMELHALVNNPDLRESVYSVRIAQDEARRSLLRLFPGISFNYAARSTTDDYVVNRHWNEAGLQISFNLLGVLSAPTLARLGEQGISLAEQRRLATQMALISQVHIARQNYANAARQFQRADKVAAVDARLASAIDAQAKAERASRLDNVAQQTASILSSLRRYQTLSNAQAAASRLQASLGLEPVAAGAESLPLPQLVQAVQGSLGAWEAAKLPQLPAGVTW